MLVLVHDDVIQFKGYLYIDDVIVTVQGMKMMGTVRKECVEE